MSVYSAPWKPGSAPDTDLNHCGVRKTPILKMREGYKWSKPQGWEDLSREKQGLGTTHPVYGQGLEARVP